MNIYVVTPFYQYCESNKYISSIKNPLDLGSYSYCYFILILPNKIPIFPSPSSSPKIIISIRLPTGVRRQFECLLDIFSCLFIQESVSPFINAAGQNPAEPEWLNKDENAKLVLQAPETLISQRQTILLYCSHGLRRDSISSTIQTQNGKKQDYNYFKRMYKIAVILLQLVVSQQQIFNSQAQFCWKNSYGRGVGTIPGNCPAGQEKLGLFCYDNCPNGYSRRLLDCFQNCPSILQDQVDYCRRAEYGRGAGYPWHFVDGLSNSGMFQRCQKVHGKGNCEQHLAIVYPKCRAGYSPVGCCICRPERPNCVSLGFKAGSQADLSCKKDKIFASAPKPILCSSSQQQQGGLCYNRCNTGYYGVGPVCWATVPKGWVECGMGAAASTTTCLSTTFNQVISVGMLAINIATFGATGEAAALEKGATLGADIVSQLKGKFADLKKLYDKNQDFVNFLKKAATVASTAIAAKDVLNLFQMSDPQPADIIRVCAEIAALVDPTGVAGVVAAYSYPLCSTIKV